MVGRTVTEETWPVRSARAVRQGGNPLAKFVVLCAHAALVLSAPGLVAKGLFALLPAVVGGRRLAERRTFKVALTFGGFLFVLQALVVPGDTLVRIGPATVSWEGLTLGGEMTLRFLGVLGGSLLFVSTTCPEDFAAAVSCTRLPYRYTYVLVLALRFLPLFRQEYAKVREAQYMRGLTLRPWRLPSHVRWTVLPVLASALTRAEGVALAMQARGFGLMPYRTSLEDVLWRGKDWWLVGMASAAVALTGWFLAGGGAGWP